MPYSRPLGCRWPAVVLLTIVALAAACGRGAPPGARALAVIPPYLDDDRVLGLIAELADGPRLPATPGYDRSLDRLAARLEAGGFLRHPADGVTPSDGVACWVVEDSLGYEVWEPGPARLEVTGPDGFLAADTEHTPMVLAVNSRPTPPEGVRTRLINLGNGTYDQEYQGRDVRGAMVYGREPALAIYRKAVLENGALGVVSPSAPSWQGSAGHPDLVPAGGVGPDGLGFQVDTATARRLEEAMSRQGGEVPVRVRVASRWLSGRTLRTLMARIPGRESGDEHVVYLAPFSGPSPGAADVSGAAVLVEVAIALRAAIAVGDLAPPRRGILFVWGANLEMANALRRHHPRWTEQMHSATIVQLIGAVPDTARAGVRIERVPDPAAIWTRPPDEHTPLGAGRPPWPFPGHYLSAYTSAVLRAAAPPDRAPRVGEVPFEGGGDHVQFLEASIPAQRLWSFPDPFYRSSLDLPAHLDPTVIRQATRGLAAHAWELGAASPGTALALIDLLTSEMEERMRQTLDDAVGNLARRDADGTSLGDRLLEKDILSAWKIWHLQAIDSVLAHPMPDEARGLQRRVNTLVRRLEERWNDRILELGLVPRPLPERFIPVRDRVR